MRSNKYTDIVSMFEMNDKPTTLFAPFSTNFDELIKYAIRKSFADFNFRTLTKTDDFKNEYKIWENDRKKLRKTQKKENKSPEPSVTEYFVSVRLLDLIATFREYFKEAPLNESQFDVWHHNTCQLFIDILNGSNTYSNFKKAYKNLAYGKAQKIINMMFKHLYCLKNADNYSSHFDHCHMVLDNFTLEWFKNNVCDERIESWSNLIYASPTVDKNDYMFYQEKIRKHISGSGHIYSGLSVFQAEFYIWPEIQWFMSADMLKKQGIFESTKCMGRKDPSVVSLCNELINKLNDLKKIYTQ